MNPARRIDNYLRQQGSPLAGLGSVFVREARKNGYDPYLLVAISGAESSFGKKLNGSYNPFGWGPGIDFGSYKDAIASVASGLRKGYFSEGRKTIKAIGEKWAPIGAGNDPTNLNSNWAGNVTEFYRELGGTGIKTGGAGGVPVETATVSPSPDAPALPAPPDLSGAALEGLSTAGTWKFDPVQQLSDLTMSVAAQQAQPTVAPTAVDTAAPLPQPKTGGDPNKWLVLPKWSHVSGAAEPGQPILNFTAALAQTFGKPLAVWDTTRHSKMTVNKNVSAHWTGNALDIPATGAKLTRLGRLALIQAGMPRKQAMRQKGGLFNVGGYQVIFHTQQGGDHSDHLHIGIRR